MIFFHGLRLYRLAAAEADMSYTPPFGGAIFFSMVRMIELLRCNNKAPSIKFMPGAFPFKRQCCLEISVYIKTS